ncbi:FkbM family methyltransferase [Methylophaga pinxianii]|uniref:FkbM family methyltransferase n=1 Tax=Methylophaga pinxianii TaxID=2881052 RepID=UPI001CF4BF3B|nr:FkbM family methyltransferase [Methylophaga pinxianii]MCB2425569.1 FkbM family methyltransferase [Methylophaga pinxianii]UPH45385.1 FkbM family methyltransferase [Methylophaga pinxianii]
MNDSRSLKQKNETLTKRVQTRYGEMVVFSENDLISESLIQYGEWAQYELDIFSIFINEGDTVVDVGGYIGTHARAFSTFVGQQGAVYTFEPNETTFYLLLKNVEYAKIDNINAFNYALGDLKSSNAVIIDDAKNHGASSVSLNSEADISSKSAVAIKKLDEHEGIRKVDFIKIDVEGMELSVINGAELLIEQSRPVIFTEVNSVNCSTPILSWAKQNGYKIFGLLTEAYNHKNYKQHRENIFGIAKETGFLLLPDEQIEGYKFVLRDLRLPVIENNDDIVLLLLHKPQYPYEVLANSTSVKALGLGYQSQLSQSYEHVLFEKETENAELRIALETQAEALKEKDKVILAGRQLIFLIQGSLSWRLTKPLRALRVLQKHGISGFRQALISRKFANIQWQIKKTQPVFDSEYYLRHYPDVAESGVNPIEHYLRFGWKENRRPNPRFDSKHYFRTHPGVAEANICPLLHCAVYGQKEKRQKNGKQQWRLIERKPIDITTTNITIILPVYRDVELTAACIDSALPDIIALGASLIIINDKSPDVGMQSMLDEKQQANPQTIKLIKNVQNLGFVASVNKGLDSSPDADVVLLNSDVIVGEKWLERLRNEAYSAEGIGTVTPLSNNTTISAFPNFLEENALPFGFSIDEIHQSFMQSTLPNLIAPTGIGFCMYIRRDCINEVGKLDEETFGRGYGEENDFCQRAIKKGWLNILTPNLYAYHEGGVSFGADKQELINNALQKIDAIHPNYHTDVRSFIEVDLLKPARVFRLIELMRRSPKPIIMHVSHGLGGGVVQHIRELDEFISRDVISIMLIPIPDTNKVKLRLGCQERDNEIVFDLDNETPAFLTIIKSIPLSCIHYHHIMYVTEQVLKLARDLDIPYQFTVHDYYLLNGNPTLTNEEFIYPGKYSDDLQNPLYPLPCDVTAADWRARYNDFWKNAERVIFPSRATQEFFEGYYPLDKSIVVWHPEAIRNMQASERAIEQKNKYRIGVLGALSREKGADFLEEIATLAKKNKMPYEFVLIGYAYRKLSNITTTGEYQEEQLSKLIEEQNLDIIFFPARWPETYSYTLSYAIHSGKPIIAPRLGVFGERLLLRKSSWLYEYPSDAEKLLKIIIFCESHHFQRPSSCSNLEKTNDEYPSQEYYSSFYQSHLKTASKVIPSSLFNLLSENKRNNPELGEPFFYRHARNIYYHPKLRWLRICIPVTLAIKFKKFLFLSKIA